MRRFIFHTSENSNSPNPNTRASFLFGSHRPLLTKLLILCFGEQQHAGFVSQWLYIKRLQWSEEKERHTKMGWETIFYSIDLFEYYSWSIDIPCGGAYRTAYIWENESREAVVESLYTNWYWAWSQWVWCLCVCVCECALVWSTIRACLCTSVFWFMCLQCALMCEEMVKIEIN